MNERPAGVVRVTRIADERRSCENGGLSLETSPIRSKSTFRQFPGSELLPRVRSDGRETLGILFERYSGWVFGVAARVLGNGRDAEGLVRDVFVDVWQEAA